MTYVPENPSAYGEDDNDDDSDDEPGDDEFHTPEPSDAESEGQQRRGYNLRRTPRVDYAERASTSVYVYMAQSDLIKAIDEPKLSVALNSKDRQEWIKSIREELTTLLVNKTWKVVTKVPRGARILSSAIILKRKRDAAGIVVRFKARLVAHGNQQSDPVDYLELYAPVACIELVRVLLSVAVANDWVIVQVDIKGAFLHADLPEDEEIYVRLPKLACLGSLSGQIVKLRRSLYGLRQAPKLWYKYFSDALFKVGFRRSMASDCLFLANLPSGRAYIIVYVDDLLIFGSEQIVSDVKDMLSKLFTVTGLGPCKYFLGIKIDRMKDGIFLSQRAYIERLVKAAGMEKAHPKKTPLPLGHRLYETPIPTTDADKHFMRDKPYHEILGALIYLSTRTRPDIATAVSMLGKFQADPGPTQWRHLQHLVRYLIHTSNHGLHIKAQKGRATLQAYSDADWAREEEKRRSRSGYLLLINGSPIIWSSRIQTATAQSTSEAEFFALHGCMREVDWVRGMLEELGEPQESPTVIYQDNLGTISWTDNVQGLRKVKHIGVKYHYVRSKVDDKTVKVLYRSSAENKADSLTKILGGDQFKTHRDEIGVVQSLHSEQ